MRRQLPTVLLALAVVAPSGCRTTTVDSDSESLPPPAVRQAPDLKEIKPASLEPDPAKLPGLDAMAVTPRPLFGDGAGSFRRLTREECRALAAQAAVTASLLEQENAVPDCSPQKGKCPDAGRESASDFRKRIRELAAQGERNKAAAEALERFYQLADVEGRVEQLHLGMVVLDKYRALIKKTPPDAFPGITLPKADELDLQRARSVGLLFKAVEGEELLNLDLKRRIGVPGGTTWRLWPADDFTVPNTPVDVEAEVKTALEHRTDLQILRLAYLELSPATLAGVKELLRGASPALAPGPLAAALTRPHPLVDAVTSHFRSSGSDACVEREVAVRKQQLFDLIAEKERGAADEVRAKTVTLNFQAKQVALAKWKYTEVKKKYDEYMKDRPFGELGEDPLLIQLHLARAELIDEVMGWHAAKVKLLEAQGLLAGPKE
jgi:hypothetical protein